MTGVPLGYSWRSLWRRKTNTILTLAGIAMAVIVVAAILMAGEGLRRNLIQSGSTDNVLFVSQPATAESRSTISRGDAALVGTLPGVAFGATGEKLIARELALPVALRVGRDLLPVTFRGTSPAGMELRGYASLDAGRMFMPMRDEIVLGNSIGKRLAVRVGDMLQVGARSWKVVGVLARSNTVTDGEIWGSVERLMQLFQRSQFSSVLMRVDERTGLSALRVALAADKRLALDLWIERDFYDQQAETLARFLRTFALFMGMIFAAGAIVGAMITQYASVAYRMREIGTLRALGFKRSGVFLAILAESFFVGVLGAVSGVLVASQLQYFTLTTLNVQSHSDISFRLLLSPQIAFEAIGFGLTMGVLGGILPALHANRLRVGDALREAG